MRPSKSIFLNFKPVRLHPLVVIGIAALATGLFVCIMLPIAPFIGLSQYFLFYYHVPIGFAFVIYLFDRMAKWHTITTKQWLVDFLVIVLALARTIALIPLISGHALFIVYAILTFSTRWSRVIALLVFLDVIFIKLVFIQDLITLIGGTVLGFIAAIITRKLDARSDVQLSEPGKGEGIDV